MLRLTTLAIITTTLFLSLFLLLDARASEPSSAPAKTGLLTEGSDAEALTAEEETQLLLVRIDGKQYRVTYPLEFTRWMHPLLLSSRIEAAVKRVEGFLGPFKKQVDTYVVGALTFPGQDMPDNLMVAGLTIQDEEGNVVVLVALPACTTETWAHELLHARMRELGLNPPVWFEEGMAHFVEVEDGFNKELFQILEKESVLSRDELKSITEVTDKEMRRRASGWALVYYLVKLKGTKLSEVVRMDPEDLPSPKEAYEAIVESRKSSVDETEAELHLANMK